MPCKFPACLKLMSLLLAMSSAMAMADAPGCKDPVLFPKRLTGYSIERCESGMSSVNFRIGSEQKSVMGRKNVVIYRANSDAERADVDYILQNYLNAFKGIGGEILKAPTGIPNVIGKVNIDGREVWTEVGSDAAWDAKRRWQIYKVTVVETDSAAQVVTADKMLESLDRDGFITLYLHFDTAKWDLKREDEPTIAQVVALMKKRSALKLSVEGHTDNIGKSADNRRLSGNRARVVMRAVIDAGIAPVRLKSAGYGPDRPIADNRAEDGRAKNRRVELVRY